MTRAFPTDLYYDEERIGQREGMELRDFFAAHIASGYHSCIAKDWGEYFPHPEDVAVWAYDVADALVKARKKRRTKEVNDGR